MPQKGQITRHEWVKVKARYSVTWKQCIHCHNCHETEQGNYVSPNGEYLKEEPACITRYPEQELSKFEQAIKDTAEEAGK